MASTPCDIDDFKDSNDNFYQAGSQAYYACKYFQSVEDTNIWRNIIAGIQAATQIYFADKQYETAKQAQNRLDNISNIELSRSGKIFEQWEKGVACEDSQLLEACGMVVAKPNLDDIRRRVSADIKRAFAGVKKQIRECYPPSCVAAMCSELNKTAREEARTLVGVVSATYQKEILLYEQRLATARSWRYQVLAFGRGSIQASTVLMEGAAKNAQLASQINPYSGYIQAVNGIANTARSISLQEANSFRGMGINMRQQGGLPTANGVQISQLPNYDQPSLGNYSYEQRYAGENASYMSDAYGQDPTGFSSDGTNGGIMFDGNGMQNNNFMGGIPTA